MTKTLKMQTDTGPFLVVSFEVATEGDEELIERLISEIETQDGAFAKLQRFDDAAYVVAAVTEELSGPFGERLVEDLNQAGFSVEPE